MPGLSISDPRLTEVLIECSTSTKKYAQTFLPEHFYRPFSKYIQDQICEALDDDTIQKLLMMAPRGGGKTSLVQRAFTERQILFNLKEFIVPISASADMAIRNSENVKRDLLTNSRIKSVFGSLKSRHWAKEEWHAANDRNTYMLPRGANQGIRGLIEDLRPDLVIGDDIETRELVRSDVRRDELLRWWMTDVCNCPNLDLDTWRIILIGTLLHEASLLNTLAQDPAWTTLRLKLFDPKRMVSFWPEHISDDGIRVMVEEHTRLKLLDELYQEFLNEPMNVDDPVFSQDYFQYYDELKVNLNRNPDVLNFVLVDPCKEDTLHSDDSAIIGVGINPRAQSIYVRDLVLRQVHNEELYDEACQMAVRLGAHVIGVEMHSLHRWLFQPFQSYMLTHGYYFDLVDLKPGGNNKDFRISALSPYYRRGHVFHNPRISRPLEIQLLGHPKSAKKDASDAFAYIIPLMEKFDIFLRGGIFGKESQEIFEREYSDIYYSPEERQPFGSGSLIQ